MNITTYKMRLARLVRLRETLVHSVLLDKLVKAPCVNTDKFRRFVRIFVIVGMVRLIIDEFAPEVQHMAAVVRTTRRHSRRVVCVLSNRAVSQT